MGQTWRLPPYGKEVVLPTAQTHSDCARTVLASCSLPAVGTGGKKVCDGEPADNPPPCERTCCCSGTIDLVNACVCGLVFALYMKLRKPLFWPHRFCFSMRRVVSAKTLRIHTAINFKAPSPSPVQCSGAQWGIAHVAAVLERSCTCPVLHLLHTYM